MSEDAARMIEAKVKELHDWRGQTLARFRRLFRLADPDLVEEVKWVKPSNPGGVAVWSHAGIVCTGEVYKDKVKFTFAKGAAVIDPKQVFNSSLEGNTRRAIDVFEGQDVDEAAVVQLFREAVALNLAKKP